MLSGIFGNLTNVRFVVAVVVLFVVLRAMETRNVLGLRKLTTPTTAA